MDNETSNGKSKKDYELQAMLYYYLKKRIEHNYRFRPVMQIAKAKEEAKSKEENQSAPIQGTEQDASDRPKRLLQQSEEKNIHREYKLFVTQICAVNPKDGSFKHFSGPHIVAKDKSEAQGLVDNTGLGYCEIIGELIGMIDNDGNDVKNAYRDN